MSRGYVTLTCPCGVTTWALLRGRFQILECCTCGLYRYEVTGVITPCNKKGNPVPETRKEKEMARRLAKVENARARKSKRATSEERVTSQLYSRNRAIVEAWKAGAKPPELAKSHEISLSRVKMIVGTALMKEWEEKHK